MPQTTRDLPPDIEKALRSTDAAPWAALVHYVDETTSTNDVAAELGLGSALEGITVVAGRQSAGRGRQGRVWVSPADAGLYASVVLRPAERGLVARRWPLLTLMAGVATSNAVAGTAGFRPEIKWPNDLIVRHPSTGVRRKLAGILAESHAAGARSPFVVLGIGVNMRRDAIPADLSDVATSIDAEHPRSPTRGELLVALLRELWDGYVRLCADAGAEREMLAEWSRLSPTSTGASVEWQTADGLTPGVTAGVDRNGALLVKTMTGIQRVIGGALRWL